MKRQQYSQDGFTLIEMMIVVVIMGVIFSVALPGYREYVQRANRADATTALMRVAAAQERFYLANGTYATDAQLGTAPPNGLGISATERDYYTLALSGVDATGYTVTASAKSGGPQQYDSSCQSFTLNEQGVRGSSPGTITTCWK